MTMTSFYNGNSYSKFDSYYEDCEHDDLMSADDYDARQYERDGWNELQYCRQYF